MAGRTIRLTWLAEPRLEAPAKYRRACHYDAYVPDPLAGMDLRLSAQVAGVAAEAEAAIRDLNAIARPALAPFARLLLRTESIASSKVEGLQLGVRELARAGARMETGGRVAPTALEIIANIEAMELAIEEAATSDRFTQCQIQAIHHSLMEQSSAARVAGRVRTVQNWIGGNDYNPCGADFVPPPPEYVSDLLHDVCAYINDDVPPPIVQAALVHAQFETIHPFDDGNGRAGRALIHVVLRRRGVARAYVPPISVILARSRDRYIAGLTAFRSGDTEAWIEHFAGAALSAAHLATGYVNAVHDLITEWRARLADLPNAPRADAAAWAIIDELPAHPIVTTPIAAAALKRSRPQIHQALDLLESAGVLVPLTAAKRNRSWEAEGLLDLLASFEAGEQPT